MPTFARRVLFGKLASGPTSTNAALHASSRQSRLRWASARGLRAASGAFPAPARRERLVTSALKFRVSSCQTEGSSVYRPEVSSVYSCFAPLAILRRAKAAHLRLLNLEITHVQNLWSRIHHRRGAGRR